MTLSQDTLLCPVCQSTDTFRLGAIAPSNLFAGTILDFELDGGDLIKCKNCYLVFRYPRPSKQDLDKLYESGNIDNWAIPGEQRTDWSLVKEWLGSQIKIQKVLDIGCFDGRFLEFLGGNYQRLGLEIHQEAARRACERGIDVIGHDFEQMSSYKANADLAVAIDVIEHTLDPVAFLEAVSDNVREGGFIALTTGNTDSFTWRLMGGQYWYCHIAEHVSFINPLWIGQIAPKLGLEVQSLQLFSHDGDAASLKQKLKEAVANLTLRFFPKLFGYLRANGFGGIDLKRYPGMALSPPYWMTAKDHLFVVFKKNIR